MVGYKYYLLHSLWYFGLISTLQYHQVQYPGPMLTRIAKDYLTIQGSSVVSEQAISSGGHTDYKTRNQLSTEVFEVLQMLKSCYKDGLIKVEEEASAHEPKPLYSKVIRCIILFFLTQFWAVLGVKRFF